MSRASRKKDAGRIVVKAGNVSVKIYPVKNRGGHLYTLTYRSTNGELVRRQFADLAKAKVEAGIVATKIQNGQVHVLELQSHDRDIYLQAQELIRPTGERLDLVAAKYAEATRLLGNSGSVIEAARFFAKHHPVKLPVKSVPEVYEEFRKKKEADGVSQRYLQDIRSRLGRFAKHFTGPISDIVTSEIEDWIGSLSMGGVGRNGTRASIITLFRFARQKRYLPKDHVTEAETVSLAKEQPAQIGIFTPEQMTVLLQHAEERFRPYLAIGAFAGLRHAELMRLDWTEVKMSQSTIVVSAQAAKTSQRRTVPIQSNLQDWLAPLVQESGRIAPGDGSRFLNRVTSVARACEITWPHNGLRHSYASYRLGKCKDAAEVALEMGNSPQMIFRHYRELVAPTDVEKWWQIVPTEK